MRRWLLLLFVVACAPNLCPEGFVSAKVNESSACVSSLSYCVSDEQCTSARFDCKRPCADLPVNVLFSAQAQEKAASCGKLDVRCKQVPFVDNRCVENQCVSVSHTAEELIPQPVYQEVVSGQVVCYEKRGLDSVLHLNILNNASIPLQQLEAYVNLSFSNGSTSVVRVDLLNGTLFAGESFEVRQQIRNAVPSEIVIFVVRPLKGKGVSFGVKNQDVVARSEVFLCGGKTFKD